MITCLVDFILHAIALLPEPKKVKILSVEVLKTQKDEFLSSVKLTIQYPLYSIQTHLIIGCISSSDTRCNTTDTQTWIYLNPVKPGGMHACFKFASILIFAEQLKKNKYFVINYHNKLMLI